MTVHQRPKRPDLVRPRKSHLPFEQLVERLGLGEAETLDLSPVGRDGMMLQRPVLCAQLLDATICIF